MSDDENIDISESKLSHIIEIILNIFLHVTILFTFLTFLFTIIITPLAKDLFKSEVGHLIEAAVANLPINNKNSEHYKNESTSQVEHVGSYPGAIDNALLDSKVNDAILNTNYELNLNPTTLNKLLTDYDKLNFNKNMSKNDKKSNLKQLLTVYKTTIPELNNLTDDQLNQIVDLIIMIQTDVIENPTFINKYIKEYNSPNYLINVHNDDIISIAKSLSLIFFIISILLIIFVKYSCNDCINVTKLVSENVITFIFVGIVELWFFQNYAFKFVPAAPSLLISSSFDTVKQIVSK